MKNPTNRDLKQWLDTLSSDELDMPVTVLISAESEICPALSLVKEEITDETGVEIRGTLPMIIID